jgi:hypothetical protein
VNWICDFLKDRSQRVGTGSVKLARMEVSTELGSWLFLIMIEDLEITSSNDLFKFVDDTTL